ncbi:MAG: type II and III secretion system protein [Bacteroidota bacterium]
MRTILVLCVFTVVFGTGFTALAQSPTEMQRISKGYISPDEIVTISRTMPFDKALTVISEVSKKFAGKIIIDPEKRTTAIGVDITGMYWKEALELILRTNSIWYDEAADYIRILSTPKGGAVVGEEIPTLRTREVNISAVFFELDIEKLNESGINWRFYRGENVNLGGSMTTNNQLSQQEVFEITIEPKSEKLALDLNAAIQFFEQNKTGEVIARPQVVVRSGQVGRMQIGTEFGVYQRDFAGNLTTQFFQAGTIIEVTPTIINQQGIDFISMTVDVQRSALTSISPPVLDKTQAKTKVLLLDGEETVIGGLYNNEESTTRLGIPILKDLPWWVFGLRYLFGYDRVLTTRKELVMIIRAELVPSLQDRVTTKGTNENLIQETLKGYRQDVKNKKRDQ